MINPLEVRKGNLVEYDGRIFCIHTIAEEFPTLDTTEFGIGVVSWGNIDPIELTEGWLKKAGFNKMPGNTFQNINLPYWCKESVLLFFNTGQEEYSFKIGYGEIVEGKYFAATFRWINKIHILQNIFYDITSKELTIKL